jgi:hypothetical protein
MKGIRRKILIDEFNNYALLHGISTSDIDDSTRIDIERDAKDKMEKHFIDRKASESEIEELKQANLALLDAYDKVNLFKEDLYGYTEHTDFDFRMERLLKIKDMILSDTKMQYKLNHGNSVADHTISADTIAKLTQIWYSADDGKEKYKEALVEYGFVDAPINSSGSNQFTHLGYISGTSVYEQDYYTVDDQVLFHIDDITFTEDGSKYKLFKETGQGQYSVESDFPENIIDSHVIDNVVVDGEFDPENGTGNGTIKGSYSYVETYPDDENTKNSTATVTVEVTGTFTIEESFNSVYDDSEGTQYIFTFFPKYTYHYVTNYTKVFIKNSEEVTEHKTDEFTDVWENPYGYSMMYFLKK